MIWNDQFMSEKAKDLWSRDKMLFGKLLFEMEKIAKCNKNINTQEQVGLLHLDKFLKHLSIFSQCHKSYLN